jgi:hypothetical protein
VSRSALPSAVSYAVMKVRQEKLIMGATENKELIRNMWAEASKGSVEGFLNGFADDVHYTIIGTTKFSGIFKGNRTW